MFWIKLDVVKVLPAKAVCKGKATACLTKKAIVKAFCESCGETL